MVPNSRSSAATHAVQCGMGGFYTKGGGWRLLASHCRGKSGGEDLSWGMFLAAANKVKRLLHLSFIGHVRAEELRRGRPDVAALLADLPDGFRLLGDLGRLESMDAACAAEMGGIMELCDQKGVGLVVRVVPDPGKDIGLNILSLFHYRRRPHTVTCETMEEAAKALAD